MITQLKAYDGSNRLWISKRVSIDEALALLAWLQGATGCNAAWIKTGSQSKKINIPKATKFLLDSYYIGADGVRTWTIPIRASAQPYRKFTVDYDKNCYVEVRT